MLSMSAIHQAPAGARDWLPLEVAQKQWISHQLQQVFDRWGYQPIVTSTLQWLDTLTAGGAIERDTVVQLQERAAGELGLRPELTASIARMAVTRMVGMPQPYRLCYSNANVFRRAASQHGRQVEFYQAGVELLGAAGILADAEILLLLSDGLHQLGLEHWHLILGEASLTQSLLAPFPDGVRSRVRRCIALLDRLGLEELDLSPSLRDRALWLFDLRGNPRDVLQQMGATALDQATRKRVNELKMLMELLEPIASHIVLDLSLLQTIDYYTGIVFEVVAQTDLETRVVGEGGRYDRLLGLYHPQGESAPGIGFALNLEDLHACLLGSPQLPQATPVSNWLVIPRSQAAYGQALYYARSLREQEPTARIELELNGLAPEETRHLAKSKGIERLVWIDEHGDLQTELI